MNKGEAINLSRICGVLTHSQQFDFGVLRVLLSNAKIQEELGNEQKGIYDLAQTAKKSEDELKAELEKHRLEEFQGEFKKLPSSVNTAKFEELEQFSLGEEKFSTLKALMILDSNGIIE